MAVMTLRSVSRAHRGTANAASKPTIAMDISNSTTVKPKREDRARFMLRIFETAAAPPYLKVVR
jgi:hypothetical protein